MRIYLGWEHGRFAHVALLVFSRGLVFSSFPSSPSFPSFPSSPSFPSPPSSPSLPSIGTCF